MTVKSRKERIAERLLDVAKECDDPIVVQKREQLAVATALAEPDKFAEILKDIRAEDGRREIQPALRDYIDVPTGKLQGN